MLIGFDKTFAEHLGLNEQEQKVVKDILSVLPENKQPDKECDAEMEDYFDEIGRMIDFDSDHDEALKLATRESETNVNKESKS